jgi:HEPN domain-containing protein
MKDETKNWILQAEEHFADAEYMYAGHRYSMCVYCFHQALEKILKATIIERADKLPSKIHNLDQLARETGLKFNETDLEDLAEITRHFWRVRYPDFQKNVYTNKESIEPTVVKSRTIYKWVSQQLEQV